MSYFSVRFDKIIRSNKINLNNYFEVLYYLIYHRYNCKLDNSSNIKKVEKDTLLMIKIKKDDPLYNTIRDLIHYELRMALPIKDINSYNKTKLIDAYNRCIERYLLYDISVIDFIRPTSIALIKNK
jgi:hypothetical protein